MVFRAPEVPEITPTELKEKLDAGDVPVLVDVREPFECAIADLPDVGQRRIPTGEFAGRAAELDPESEIVVYCRSGSRSAWAVALLRQQGFERVYNLQGGVLGWRSHVDPSLSAY
jgi:adenylyltransferase/sulfurtransferase